MKMDLKKIVSFFPASNLQNIFQGNHNLECQHTIKSHGRGLLWNHKNDWLILIFLGITDIVLNIIHPFYRFVDEEMMDDLKFPLKDNTVPLWAVPVYAVLLPIFIFALYYMRRKDVYDLHHATLGLSFAVLITAVLTDAIKDGVGRPRPDFFWRCFPDGQDNYDRLGDVICNGKDSVVKEGHKSFPSGHASWSFAGLDFLSLYLAGKLKAFDRKGHVAKLCCVFLPVLGAALVGVSRVNDYWHHWEDVFAGGLLGSVVAVFCYLQFFPSPFNKDGSFIAGCDSYAYREAVEELRSNTQPGDGMGAHLQSESSRNNPLMDSTVEDVESGRR